MDWQRSDGLVGEGTKNEMLDRYANMPRAHRTQGFMMLSGMKFNHLEIDNLLGARRGILGDAGLAIPTVRLGRYSRAVARLQLEIYSADG
jgi:hypothetical protein